ncbi:MAG: geranylgeranylglyceryl/heptaprenylglyceryl phosphate synthase [Flavobacteriaceae bacterium]|nr:geranylgeranylglyceryl/heptaprenylglyceryl phosphate synthase [Flavobacteriaceae bacterium]
MVNIYQNILQAKKAGQKLLAILIDPEKIQLDQIHNFIKLVNQSIATHIFVGGSTDENNQIEAVVSEIKKHTILPVILFPGDFTQITSKADGILFLSLLSGRNPEYLIEQQVQSALTIKASNLEVIPTGYILIEGGKETAVERISNTEPIPQSNSELILKTALAGEFSGKKLIYLEAGSGATKAVDENIINCVKTNLRIPLIVGGGIRTKKQLDKAYESGADLVVIGTAFENNPSFFNELKKLLTNENIG